MREESLTAKPKMYESVTDNARIERFSDGSEVNSTKLPVIDPTLRFEVIVPPGGISKTVKHGLGKRYDCFVRMHKAGENIYYTLPYAFLAVLIDGNPQITEVSNITEEEITIDFKNIGASSVTWEVEVYFVNFTL